MIRMRFIAIRYFEHAFCISRISEYNRPTSFQSEMKMKRILLSACLLVSVISPVLAVDMSREIDAAAVKLMPKMVVWRRHLHQYPELSNREVKTAKYVEDHLRKLG